MSVLADSNNCFCQFTASTVNVICKYPFHYYLLQIVNETILSNHRVYADLIRRLKMGEYQHGIDD